MNKDLRLLFRLKRKIRRIIFVNSDKKHSHAERNAEFKTNKK